jgi:hypothetical protein
VLHQGRIASSSRGNEQRARAAPKRDRARRLPMKSIPMPGQGGSRPLALGPKSAPVARYSAQAEVNVVHPGAIKAYLDAVDRLQVTLAAPEAEPERRLLHELIERVVVHRHGRHEIRGRLAALLGSPATGVVSLVRLRESNHLD